MAPKTKGSIEAFKALARSMYFSNESCEWFAQEASAGQIQIACRLIEVEQEVRARRKKERLFRKAAFPQTKSFDGYDFSQVGFPEGYGAEDLKSLEFIERAQDFVFHGQTGRGKRIWRSLSAGRPWRPADACGSSRRRGWSCS